MLKICKGFLLVFILIVVFWPCGDVFAAARPNSQKGVYSVSSLTGGTQGSLDSLDQTGDGDSDITDGTPNRYDLVDGDAAIYGNLSGTDGTASVYVYDADGTDAEDSPLVIRPDDYGSSGVWRLTLFRAVGFILAKESGVAGYVGYYEANSTDTDYVGWMGPASIAESFSHQFSNTQPAGSFYLWGTPTGTGDPNNNKVSGCTIVTPGTGVTTALAVNVGSAGAFVVNGGALGTPSSGDGSNISNVNAATGDSATGFFSSGTLEAARLPAATTSAQGASELATATETSTGTDTGRVITPDGLAGSVHGQKEIGWTIYDSDASTAVADGKQAACVPASWYNGGAVSYNLVDFTCSIADQNSASGGATTVVLRRVRAGTPQDMTSTGVTISYNEYTASDEVVDTSYDDVQSGDMIYPDVNAVTTGAAHLGLSCTAVFQIP